MARTIIAIVDDLFFASKIRGTAEQIGVGGRLANAVVSYFRYVRKMFWPDDLAIYE